MSAPAPSRRPDPARPRLVVVVLVIALAPAVGGVVVRLVPALQDRLLPTLAASFVPYALVGWLVAAVVATLAAVRGTRPRAHRRVMAVVAAVAVAGTVLQLSWLSPLVTPDRPAAPGERLTVVTVNLRGGSADPDQLGRELADVDVALLVEIGASTVTALDRSGVGDRFPHRVGEPGVGVVGTMIWSRFPLRDGRRIAGRLGQWTATAELPGLGPVQLTAVHPCNPPCGIDVWHTESETVRAAAGDPSSAAIMAGDFNATDDHVTMRRLYDDGWASAVDLAGAGWLPTYPANGFQRPAGVPIPPVIAIDHVLLGRRLTATSVTRFGLDGTDHLGLRAVVAPAA